jgi:DNA integrity scanning protein DisA with diadenylate cyclase activity
MRPNVMELVERIIKPNGYRVKKLVVQVYRKNVEKMIEMIKKLDKEQIVKIEIKFEGGFIKSEEEY